MRSICLNTGKGLVTWGFGKMSNDSPPFFNLSDIFDSANSEGNQVPCQAERSVEPNLVSNTLRRITPSSLRVATASVIGS